MPIVPEETLLIFDEVQACERALTSLKYFCEDAPQYHVVAAGSLLGVAIHREKYSFPVGKVYMKTMCPLRFDEFLWAVGQEGLEHLVREHYASMTPMPEASHRELRGWWLRYLYVGGMPAAVNKYTQEQSLINVAEIQELIVSAYTADMSKYATESDATKIRAAYLSLPAQLAKENKKFQYVHARSLRQYCRLYAPELAIRITGRNFGCEGGIRSVPLYAAYCI